MKEIVTEPCVETFPDLSGFAVILHDDDTFFLGAGLLADGLIVPLFPDKPTAQGVIEGLSEDPRDMKLKPAALGDPFKAMRKAAGEGATGFQFSSGMFTEAQRKAVFAITKGRILFPFMTRHSEVGSQWPTVLGSASLCNAGTYLTRRGEKTFGPHELMQWVRWDVMDRASAKLSEVQPFRSHEPGEPFWCLSSAAGDVSFTDGDNWYAPKGNAVVLFARDSTVRQFLPPEGYYPVFTSEEAGVGFLTERLGGAFHILSIAKTDKPNLAQHEAVMAQDLGSKGALQAVLVRVDNLPNHLSEVQNNFSLPPYATFVINPAGHREETAWGTFPSIDNAGVIINSVGATWELTSGHEYRNVSRFDQFSGHDTFFLGPLDFQLSDLGRSLGSFDPVIDGEDLRILTPIETTEMIREFVIGETNGTADDSWRQGPVYSHEKPIDNIELDSAEELVAELHLHLPFLGKWVLNYWDTVDGEYFGPFYFDSPFHLARGLCTLEIKDRSARVDGRYGHGSIGFDGSYQSALESAVGNGLVNALVEICVRMKDRGYRPCDAVDMAAAVNRVLRSLRVSICGNVADLLVSHISTGARTTEQLLDQIGFNPAIHEMLLGSIKADVDPEGERLLTDRIGPELQADLLPRTKLFLATALLQFQNLGRSPCVDYAPVSVQVVKALEYEMRELAAYLVDGFLGKRPDQPMREEDTLFFIHENRREKVSLGSITYAIKALRSPTTEILEYAAKRLADIGLDFMTTRATWRLILGDVLEKYRNRGAHEHAISYDTCEACIRDLIGLRENPGLVFAVAAWRSRSKH